MDGAESKITGFLKHNLPQVQAIYLFGSRASGQARPDSDYDLAVYLGKPVDARELWQAAQSLSALLDCDVNLIDLQTASTVMQYQIISKGRRLWKEDSKVDLYETYILREKLDLDERREAQIREILKTGRVYGKRYPDQQGRHH